MTTGSFKVRVLFCGCRYGFGSSLWLKVQELAVAITFKECGKVFCINGRYRFHGSKLRTHGLPGVVVAGFGVGTAGKETFAKTRVITL